MYIRELVIDELDQCGPFGEAFHKEKAHPDAFSLPVFLENWERFYQQGIGVIFGLFEDDDVLIGGIGGLLAKDLTSGTLTLNEMFWYVQNDKRQRTGRWPLRLITRLRMWGALRHAKRLHMIHFFTKDEHPDDVRLSKIYTHILKLEPNELGFVGAIGV